MEKVRTVAVVWFLLQIAACHGEGGGSEDDAGTVRNDASSPALKHVLVK